MDSGEADLADESTFGPQYSLERDVFQDSVRALHDSAGSGEVNDSFSLPLSTPKVKSRIILLMANFDFECEQAVLSDINILCYSGSKCSVCYQDKILFRELLMSCRLKREVDGRHKAWIFC